VGETLNTTALVHEAYVKLVDAGRAQWHDRHHFLAVASIAMRQILVDHARSRLRAKRGGGAITVPLDEAPGLVAREARDLLDLDEALGRLEATDPRLVRVVECRYFTGLGEQETADALGVSLRTVQRDWLKARAWLRAALRSAAGLDATSGR
jgi:RNA polymerase sigma factor (TIGR02999 family)